MTPHIEAKKEDIAKLVIMPGDPLRARLIAERYLSDVKMVNQVRNIFGYTGIYKGKKITVLASGMGNPSMGIYSYELFKFYDVDTIIRVGSCGAYQKTLKLFDIILVDNSYSESPYALIQNNNKENILPSDENTTNIIAETADEINVAYSRGTIHCCDVFSDYCLNDDYLENVRKYNCLGAEMETFALFQNAKVLGKKAACILTVADIIGTSQKTTSEERERALTDMIELALESSIKI